jgi:hypothetical protein
MTEKRTPWMKFYGADWRANAQLRLCSLAARGLWVEMLCIAHDAEPYGHVLIAGRIPSAAQIAIQVGAAAREVEKLTAELEAAGVFDRSEAGAIVSRRMVRDREKAERDARFGKAGGNPKLKPTHNGGVNPPDNPDDNGPDKAQMPDARSQMPTKDLARSAPRSRGTRLPDDWAPDGDDLTFGLTHLGREHIGPVFDKFRDYWVAKAGAGGVKADWSATWRNWVRREAEAMANGKGQHGRGSVAPAGKSQRDIQLAAAVEAARRAGSGYTLWDADQPDGTDPH